MNAKQFLENYKYYIIGFTVLIVIIVVSVIYTLGANNPNVEGTISSVTQTTTATPVTTTSRQTNNNCKTNACDNNF